MAKRHKNKFKSHIYLKALTAWIFYLVTSNSIVIWAVHTDQLLLAYLIPFIYGSLGGIIFLYLFTHQDFFKFAHEIEKRELKIEKKLYKLFHNHLKVGAVCLTCLVGGPVLSAAGAKLFLTTHKYKYLILILVNIPSTLLTISIGRGLISATLIHLPKIM